ncbi:unknown [Prevotella sp. CAG:1124]|nr:unknown [Prevotella sp. CAG:1124]
MACYKRLYLPLICLKVKNMPIRLIPLYIQLWQMISSILDIHGWNVQFCIQVVLTSWWIGLFVLQLRLRPELIGL